MASWLSKAWETTTEFVADTVDSASQAIDVIMDDPRHAAAVFIDGVEHGITDVGGVVLGAIPDLIDYGSERYLGVNLYNGSAMQGISDGMMWAIDGTESLFGIEKPVISGAGDEFLFGAGRVSGQVIGAVTVVGAGGAILNAAQHTAQGAWWVASTGYKAASVVSTTATVATVGGVAAVGVDLNYNEGRVTGNVISGASNWAIRQATGYDNVGDAWEDIVPEPVQEAIDDFMAFMGDNPELAKWASFGVSFLLGNSLIGAVMGNSMISNVASFALAGIVAWGISDIFKDKALSYSEDQPENKTAPEVLEPSQTQMIPTPTLALS